MGGHTFFSTCLHFFSHYTGTYPLLSTRGWNTVRAYELVRGRGRVSRERNGGRRGGGGGGGRESETHTHTARRRASRRWGRRGEVERMKGVPRREGNAAGRGGGERVMRIRDPELSQAPYRALMRRRRSSSAAPRAKENGYVSIYGTLLLIREGEERRVATRATL